MHIYPLAAVRYHVYDLQRLTFLLLLLLLLLFFFFSFSSLLSFCCCCFCFFVFFKLISPFPAFSPSFSPSARCRLSRNSLAQCQAYQTPPSYLKLDACDIDVAFHSTPPTGGVESIRGNSVRLSVRTSSLQHFQSRAFKSSQNHVGPNILYIIG